MTTLKPIPPIAVVQAVARNGAQYHNTHNLRHAFAVRGQNLPEESSKTDSDSDAELDSETIKSLFSDVEEKHSQLKFELHESLNRILVSVIDRETGELIRQIPGEAAIATAEHLKSIESGELQAGMFLSSRV